MEFKKHIKCASKGELIVLLRDYDFRYRTYDVCCNYCCSNTDCITCPLWIMMRDFTQRYLEIMESEN